MSSLCHEKGNWVYLSLLIICLGAIKNTSTQIVVRDSLSTASTIFVTDHVNWTGTIELKTGVVIAAGAVLTIEAGAVLRFTSAAAIIVVKGTLLAVGRPDARIVFDGTDMGMGVNALYISGAAGVNVSHATFGHFSLVVRIYSGSDPRSIHFEDCIFEQNNLLLMWQVGMYQIFFVRCDFIRNQGVVGSGIVQLIDSCKFLQSELFLQSPTVAVNCIFMNNTAAALSSGFGGSVLNCLFLWNNIGVYCSMGCPSVRNSLFVSNDIAVFAQYSGTRLLDCVFLSNRVTLFAQGSVRVIGGWMCVRPRDSRSDLIQVASGVQSVEINGVWLGTSGQNEAIIRGSIKDEYWFATSGLVSLINLADGPTMWPDSLQQYNSSYATLCSAPEDRSFDLLHPPRDGDLLPSCISLVFPICIAFLGAIA